MASQFKCIRCDKKYQTKQQALECCLKIAEHIKYECLHCEDRYASKIEAANCCCKPIELHDINTYKALFLPLWQADESHKIIPEFIEEHAENQFKITLPFTINPIALQDAMIIALYLSPLLEITADSFVLDCQGASEQWIIHNCNTLLAIFQEKPSWTYLVSTPEFDLLKYLSIHKKCIENQNMINHVLEQVNQLGVKAIHFDVFQGQCWVTDQEDRTVIRVDYVNYTLQGPDSVTVQLLRQKTTQTNQEAHHG